MTFHRNLINDDLHAVSARTFTDIAARDADLIIPPSCGPFQLDENINKMIRVDSPLSYFVLVSLNPTVWEEVGNTAKDSFTKLIDTPSSYTGESGKVAQVNAAENAVEFGQKLRTTDSPTFSQITVGNTGVIVGISIPFSDNTGVLTLQNIDALDAITESTIEAAIDSLANLTSIQSHSVSLSASLTIEATSLLNQDLTTDANPTFNDLLLTGDLVVQGNMTTLDTVTLQVEDKNVELAVVASPSDCILQTGLPMTCDAVHQ